MLPASSVPAHGASPGATPGGVATDPFVFISHSARDREVADTICRIVEAAGVRCWIAPRDVQPGCAWRPSIIEAIERCDVMVLVFSDYANQSQQVSREVEVAFEEGKTIIPFRIENTEMNKSLRYCISATHWLDALTPPLSEHVARLVTTLVRLMADAKGGTAPGAPAPGPVPHADLPLPPPVRALRLVTAPLPGTAPACAPAGVVAVDAVSAVAGPSAGERDAPRIAGPPPSPAVCERGPRPSPRVRGTVMAAAAIVVSCAVAARALGGRTGPEPASEAGASAAFSTAPAQPAAAESAAVEPEPVPAERPAPMLAAEPGAAVAVPSVARQRGRARGDVREPSGGAVLPAAAPAGTSLPAATGEAAAPAPVSAAASSAAEEGAGDMAADARAIEDEVRGFAALLESRDPARVEAAYPGAGGWLSARRDFLSGVGRLRVRVTGMETPVVEGGTASVAFTAQLQWSDAGGTGRQQLRFEAGLRRAGGRWVIVRMDAR